MRRSAIASSLITLAPGLALGLLAGCPDRSIDEVKPQQGRVEFKDIPVNVNRDLDLLFVIDNSPSMRDKQVNLAANFPRFIDVLSSIPGGLPNVHIGVVTPDMGTQAAGDQVPGPQIGTIGQGGCANVGDNGVLEMSPALGTNRFIRDVVDPATGMRDRNYTGNLADVFAELATGVGAGGCGFEQHLAAVQRALDNNPANAGFLRDRDDFLGVIFIADEDDCSLEHASLLGPESPELGTRQSFRCTRFGVQCDQGGQTSDAMNQLGIKSQCHPNDNSAYLTKVNDYVSFLQSLKDDPRRVVVAGIMGTTEPFVVERRRIGGKDDTALAHSCTYIGGDIDGDGVRDPEVADPPIRIKFFLDQFPNRNTFATICQQDLSGGLTQIGDLLRTVIGNPCIEGKLADADPSTPEVNYDCSVSSVINRGTADEQETILPLCTPPNDTATNQPCWHVSPDPVACPSDPADPNVHPGNLVLAIEGQDTLPTDAHIIANCVTEVTNN